MDILIVCKGYLFVSCFDFSSVPCREIQYPVYVSPSKKPIQESMLIFPNHERKHRHLDNSPEDNMWDLLQSAEQKSNSTVKGETHSRKPHFKV